MSPSRKRPRTGRPSSPRRRGSSALDEARGGLDAGRKADADEPTEAERILGPEDQSLLDIVDNLLNKGVVLSGEITLALAQVDLVYARISLLLSAADRVLPGEDTEFIERHHARQLLRKARRRSGA